MSEIENENGTEASPKKPFSWGIAAIWIAVFSLLLLLGWGLLKSNETRPEAGEVAPNLDMQYFDGYEWEGRTSSTLEEMRGNVVVLNFWASWCVECRIEAEDLEANWKKYEDDGVIYLGIAHVDVEPKSIEYLEEFRITYPNAPDLGGEAAEKYEITGVPETFVIDQEGTIVHVQLGPMSTAQLDAIIGSLLN